MFKLHIIQSRFCISSASEVWLSIFLVLCFLFEHISSLSASPVVSGLGGCLVSLFVLSSLYVLDVVSLLVTSCFNFIVHYLVYIMLLLRLSLGFCSAVHFKTTSLHQARGKYFFFFFLFCISTQGCKDDPSIMIEMYSYKKKLTKFVQLAACFYIWRRMKCKEKHTVNNIYKPITSWPVLRGCHSEHSCLLIGAHCVDVFEGQILHRREDKV